MQNKELKNNYISFLHLSMKFIFNVGHHNNLKEP